jgi:ABC-2 type transport system permease protein
MRALLFQKVFRADYLLTAGILDLVLLAAGAWVFFLAFRNARQRGALLQMGE